MNASPLKQLAALGLSAWLAGSALAAPRAVEPFDGKTWPQLQTTLKHPMAVVFTTTDCAHCPAVITQLRQEIARRKLKATLAAVVMDQAPADNDAALLRDRHYQPVDRLLAFSGQAAKLRFAVDPRWRGVTPYVVLLAPQAAALAVIGPPGAADLDAWVHAAAHAGMGH